MEDGNISILLKTSLGYNGISGVTMNYFKNMSRNRIKVDFMVSDSEDYMRKDYLDYITKSDSELIILPQPFKHIFKYTKKMRKYLRQGKYHVIHIHGNSGNMLIDVLIALSCGVKVRITHCHNTSCHFKLLHYIFKPFLNIFVTERFACSSPAGKWLYDNRPFKIVQNGINFDEYNFNQLSRREIRQNHRLSDELVLCHVGSFIDAKNHSYLIEVFKGICDIKPESVLILIGEGPLLDNVKNKVISLGLDNKVIFVGNTPEVSKYYSAADVFILPSKFEGLPLVLIEAQIAGLACVVSDNISNEVIISDHISKLSIQSLPITWSRKIIEISQLKDREHMTLRDYATNFDIKKNSREMENFYIDKTKQVYKLNE